ncbi:MAG: hypothetical protein ACI837_000854 [Crocinitomicaceae bacterium]|jgi:hypothetical protein
MKKLITSLSVFALLLTPTFVNAQEITASFCVEPKGELLGTIHQLEAQGYTLTDLQCAPINYLVAPTPPYLNQIISVTMREIHCPEFGQGPCFLLSTTHFTAEEIVQNSVGATIHTNISPILIAL